MQGSESERRLSSEGQQSRAVVSEDPRHGSSVLLRSSQLEQLRVESGVVQVVGSRGSQYPADSADQGCRLLTLNTGGRSWSTGSAAQHLGRLDSHSQC